MPDKPAVPRRRNTKVGQVVKRSGNKTIVVEVTRRVQDTLYKRFTNRSKKFHAHDEQNQCQVGDRVRIVETRPLSRLKRWRLEQILHRPAVLIAEEQQPESLSTPAPSSPQEPGS